MSQKLKNWLMIFIVVFLIGTFNIEVQAAEGQVQFGSSQYSVQLGETFPIGVYVESDQEIGSYSLTLYYDSNLLEYVSGGTLAEAGILYLDGAGNETNYQHMLSFRSLKSGNTNIAIEQASGILSSTPMEEIIFESLPSAPIIIDTPIVNTGLKTLQISGYENDIEFDPTILKYVLNVPNEIETLNFLTETLDPNAEVIISDSKLITGKNVIYITVMGNNTEPTVYEISVFKEEPAVLIEEETTQEKPIDDKKEFDEKTELIEEFTIDEEPIKTSGLSVFKNSVKKWLMIEEKINVRILSGVLIFIVVILITSRGIKGSKRIKLKKEKKRLVNEPIHIIDLNKDDIEKVEESNVIRLENISMKFRMAQDEASSLKEFIIKNLKRRYQYRYLTALDRISFSIQRGDVVGIIGTNGSGKSTILKIISGALRPTEGNVYVDHKKVQLLTLGTGFDMELTAKENVYLNGAIIGYKKEYIDEKYEEIVKFAELDGFMEERMKNFSTGMVSRLGFAIATLRESPEILILDEVLTVGDMFFRKKSEERIKKMIHSGSTVLIVAHSMDTILKTCNKAIWIEKGILQMVGSPKEVCGAYGKMDINKN